MTIGEKIKQLRKEKEISQQELCEEIGVSTNVVSWWEKGKFEPTIFNAIVLADYFGVTLDELCCREVKVNGKDN